MLVEDEAPVGGRWSFDTENRKKLPKGYRPPPVRLPTRPTTDVAEAIAWVAQEFPDAPGDPATFAWPTTREEARTHLAQFLDERFADFGPYEDAISAEHARNLLMAAPGLVVLDEPALNRYPLAREAEGRDEVYVGRIREDSSHDRGLVMWIVADNLRKGAATNAVQIAEVLGQRALKKG